MLQKSRCRVVALRLDMEEAAHHIMSDWLVHTLDVVYTLIGKVYADLGAVMSPAVKLRERVICSLLFCKQAISTYTP